VRLFIIIALSKKLFSFLKIPQQMKVTILLLFFSFCSIQLHGQIFHEDFEIPDSVVYSGSVNWSPNNRISTSASYCDSASIISPGDVATMTTISFSTVGYNAVFLYFNHICKIEFFDNGIIEVSPDNGITWYQLIDQPGFPGSDNCVYYGNGLYNSQTIKFMVEKRRL